MSQELVAGATSGAPIGARRCYLERAAELPRRPVMLRVAAGVATVGGRQCCYRWAAVLPSVGGRAAMGERGCYHPRKSVLS